MTEWSTINIPSKFKEELSEHIEGSTYSNVKEFILYAARKQMEEDEIDQKIEKKLQEHKVMTENGVIK